MSDLLKGKSKEFQEVFKEYKIMRNKIRKPMTDYAEKLILKKLDKISDNEDDQIAMLEYCIMNSWQGIYSPKYN